jgi:hypothetical protein
MGGKGPSGPQSDNEAVVAMQQQQGLQAKNANVQRNARLDYGKNLIQGMFEGTPSGATTLDLSSIAGASPYSGAAPAASMMYGTSDPNAGLEAQWSATHGGNVGTANYRAGATAGNYGGKLANGYSWGVLGDTGGQTAYGIYDPSGQLVSSADNLKDLAASKIYIGGDPNTKVGGFGDDFYNKYRQSILDYYTPQEGDQYATARSDLSASLARAGQLDSSTATYDIGKLAKQDALNRAQIASQADTQTGALRTTISQDEQSALNQLYSTEDPSVAANTAGNMVASAQLTKPLLNPAGALFQPISVGVGNALSGFMNPTSYINPNTGTGATPTGVKDYGSTQVG